MEDRKARSTEQSWTKYRYYEPFLATGTGTLSKRPRFEPEEPCYMDHGKGCRLWDIDGNEYIDFRNGLGAISLGYCYPAVNEAVKVQLEKGAVFSHPCAIEGEVAQLIVQMVPCAEKVRYLKTGGEACAAAFKIARAVTGRDIIAQCGYNGWLNSLATGANVLPRVREDTPKGVPVNVSKLHRAMPWNDLEAYEKLFAEEAGNLAAVAVSMNYPNAEQGPAFLNSLRELTRKHGALLILDEIVSGFRVALGGYQEYCNVDCDLAIFAKGLANGLPLSVVTGKAPIMDEFEKAIVSSTYSGEALSLAAAKAALNVYRKNDVIGHLYTMGARFQSGLNALFEQYGYPLEARGLAPCSALVEHERGRTVKNALDKLFRESYTHGLSLYTVCYINFSHQEHDIDEALSRLEDTLKALA
ncbi:MAG: aminotransferase class III-fold pyridoxal phosphate-dependent enzyme [Candidatus Hydrogenedentota bacterium]